MSLNNVNGRWESLGVNENCISNWKDESCVCVNEKKSHDERNAVLRAYALVDYFPWTISGNKSNELSRAIWMNEVIYLFFILFEQEMHFQQNRVFIHWEADPAQHG